MCKKSSSLTLCALAMTVALGSTAWGALAGHWKLDETSGTVAADSSGNGLNGTVQGGATWVAGKIGGAWQADGTDDYILIPHSASLNISNAITVAFWIRASGTRQVISKGGTAGSAWYNSYGIRLNGTVLNWRGDRYTNSLLSGSIPNIGTEWTHVAITFDVAVPANNQRIHVNGVLNAQNTSTNPLSTNTNDVVIGRDNYGSGRWYLLGALDDFRIYDEALAEAQIQAIMTGRDSGTELATRPVPADGQTDAHRDAVLSWKSGPFAATHDVYFGTSRADVDAATTANPLGTLAGAGQDANTFDPTGLLEFGQTYYWRVDEVNAAPDSTVFKGSVWSFTVEPYAYPLTNITATASSSHNADMGPQKTVDGSGLDAAGLHGTTDTTMWLSNAAAPQPAWIQYDFDRICKLHEMWVWNSNQAVEASVGFGAKDVAIEYSMDNSTWTVLGAAHEFTRAPGTPGYAHNTTVDFGGVAARYVRLTINSNWGTLPQSGLSEVRFYYVPVRAREPKPASTATGVSTETILSWRAGREAASHQLYLSTDKQAVVDGTAPVVTPAEASYTPSSLDLGATYYWKVVEVNNAASPATWESDVWSFSTAAYVAIDDFESYANESPNRLFQTWIDGYGFSADEFFPAGNPGNGTGAAVGHDIWTAGGPYFGKSIAETTIIHSGKQSMPLYYDNSSVATSEAQRTWTSVQNWTTNAADTLTLYFRGNPIGFMETSPGKILMNGVGTDIYGTADQGRFVYKQLAGDGSIVARVDSLTATNAWAKAGVMIRSTLDAGAAWGLALASPANGAHFQARLTLSGGATSDTVLTLPSAQTTAQIPLWVKLERKGDQFTAYYATGETPTTWIANPWNPQTIAMNAQVYIGLAVTSHAAGVVTQAEFSNVTTTGTVTGQWQSESLGIEQPAGNTPDTLYLTVEDSSGHKATVVNSDPLAVAAGAWTPWSIPLSTLTSAGVKANSIKKMAIGIGDQSKPASKATGLIYIDDIAYGKPVPAASQP